MLTTIKIRWVYYSPKVWIHKKQGANSSCTPHDAMIQSTHITEISLSERVQISIQPSEVDC